MNRADSLRIWYKRIFVSFVSVFMARILMMILFGYPALIAALPVSFVRGLLFVMFLLNVLYIILYVVYGIWSIRAAKYLKKNVLVYGAYFVFLPIVLFILLGTPGFIGVSLLSNAITGSILAVYWLLYRELSAESESLSLFR